jgi:hypothetical protein
MHSSSPHECYIPCPSHPPWLDHSNYIWRRVIVMKLLIMLLSPTSYYSIPEILKALNYLHIKQKAIKLW